MLLDTFEIEDIPVRVYDDYDVKLPNLKNDNN